MSIETGGSAFPEVFTDVVGEQGEYHCETYSAGGMSLRDYFAAKAMQGILAGNHPIVLDPEPLPVVATVAYKMADAMLKAREA